MSLPGHIGWEGLHGPVTYMGYMLFSDNPEVMKLYWKGFCTPGGFLLEELMEAFPVLEQRLSRVARKPCGDADVVFVFIDGELLAWPAWPNSPSIEELRGAEGKQIAITWLQGMEEGSARPGGN